MSLSQSGKFRIASLSAGHLVNDWYMNYIQVMLPFFAAAGVPVGKGSLLVTAFTVTSSILQPLFGYFGDRRRSGVLACGGTLLMAALLSLTGFVHWYPGLFVLVALSGIGTALFHPNASALVAASSGERKATSQAVFITAGNIGWALAPVAFIPFISHYGMKAAPWIIVPGALSAAALYLVLPQGTNQSVKSAVSNAPVPSVRDNLPVLSRLVGVVALRSLTYFGMVSFLSLYLQSKGVSVLASGKYLFAMLFAGAMGGLVGGHVADRWSRKGFVCVTLFSAGVFFELFIRSSGASSFVFLTLAGGFLLSSFSVTVVMAQSVLKGRAALASGLMLGFSTGIGGIGVGLFGHALETYGAGTVIGILSALPFAAGLLALFLPSGSAKR